MRTWGNYGSLSVCYQSTTCLRLLCNKMNIPTNFSPSSQDFQLRDFVKCFLSRVTAVFFPFSATSTIFFLQFCKLVSPLRILRVPTTYVKGVVRMAYMIFDLQICVQWSVSRDIGLSLLLAYKSGILC